MLPRNKDQRGREKEKKETVSIADATLASPQLMETSREEFLFSPVSIADATLASPQLEIASLTIEAMDCFNRRRDACFPATKNLSLPVNPLVSFQSQTRRLLPRNFVNGHAGTLQVMCQSQTRRLLPRTPYQPPRSRSSSLVSIADATLASPQHPESR